MLFDQSDPPSGESRKRAKKRLQIFFTSIQALAGIARPLPLHLHAAEKRRPRLRIVRKPSFF
ncbi:MAG: hypothetical protein C4530_10905 [Desulfobacteraceae bacterium]|nr:MAG: hypothetical protein C4530_10905 [Desulfobacteraceae bacterium]